MFCQKKCLRLFETDATGVLYFAQQFRIAQELFETYLEKCGLSLGQSLNKGDYLWPIVHAEGNFLAPIKVGDELKLLLSVQKIGSSSFTLGCQFRDVNSNLLGTTSIVHVTVDRKQWASTPIPIELRKALEEIEEKSLIHLGQ